MLPTVVPRLCASQPLSSSAIPQVPQEGLPGDALRSFPAVHAAPDLGAVCPYRSKWAMTSTAPCCRCVSASWVASGWMCLVPSGGGAPRLALRSVCVPRSPLLLVDTSCSGVCGMLHLPQQPSGRPSARRPGQAEPGRGGRRCEASSTGREAHAGRESPASPRAPPCKCPWRPRAPPDRWAWGRGSLF